jgi:hypothetical protein
VWTRKPTANPTPVISTMSSSMRTASESIRLASTAARAMGRDRIRSIAPLARSSAKPTPVVPQ